MTMGDTPQAPNKAKLSFLRSMQMVTWAFFGLRSRSAAKDDFSQTNPVAIVVAGIIGAALFIFGCISVVNLVLSK
ncbi:MAG TPA: DUF2970 domain-containing protein [Burkholderiaceae bacterium]|nr:DUF2970 domain-containing protein [Burkholderiaceae bacterium]